MLILLADSSRLHGIIRDKATFSERLNPDGTVSSPGYSRYLVRVSDRPDEEALLDQEHIARDRRAFTKHMLRAFIKNNVTREAWNGAPWLVKPSIAEHYKLPMEIPNNLLYDFKVNERRSMKKTDADGLLGLFTSQRLPELKPAAKAQKPKPSIQDLARAKKEQYQAYQRALNGESALSTPSVDSKPTIPDTSRTPQEERKQDNTPSIIIKSDLSRPPSPPPIKYPIEDLDIAPNRDKPRRPSVKFLENELDADANDEYFVESEIEPELVGVLLEIWNTLNVYCEVFQLDSFTFDDFVQAMRFSSEEVDCELFVEIHCAVLKKLVNAENDQGGAIQVSLPDLDSESDDESDEEEDESSPEPVVTRMATRSSLAKAGTENLNAGRNGTAPDSTNTKIHRAAEMFEGYSWIDRLRKRDFRNGGWELVMIGLLNHLSIRPRLENSCNEILTHLAPLDAEPTQETARLQYSTLDLDFRANALQIICMLSLETKAIKNYMEECSNQMTDFRKEKIEYQRERKQL